MLRLAGSWVWAFWLVDDGESYHAFFLQAPRRLGDPSRRHYAATIGHAVSRDLRTWESAGDALGPSLSPAFDDLAVWTGSTVAGPDGKWHMFYTGVSAAEEGLVQRVGSVVSDDLYVWERPRTRALVAAEPQWYETLGAGKWPHEAWRDPWVFRDPAGDGWHMLTTARANHGEADGRGVVGHAISKDLTSWEVRAPLSRPGMGFGQLEDLQVEVIDGRPFLLFSCHAADMARGRSPGGGIWAVAGTSVLGEWPVGEAQQLTDDSLYCGRAIRDRWGSWVLLAFRNVVDGEFIGEISDPMPLGLTDEGKLKIAGGAGQ